MVKGDMFVSEDTVTSGEIIIVCETNSPDVVSDVAQEKLSE